MTEVSNYELAELTIPVSPEANQNKYLSRHVDVQVKTPEQRRALRQLIDGLDASGERLKSGRRVQSGADAFRWILENISMPNANKIDA
ncbi:hypothetical protein Pla110_44290 [Polystyrenella longa]|uniref:Uncharacterized protein n=2 Tax=Polystyrenella longa TaxID=2528007 RepID=A0A518CTY9_9PLAN|nr:hypothetical protein Pla110_44290 [Polystyrenella longa]